MKTKHQLKSELVLMQCIAHYTEDQKLNTKCWIHRGASYVKSSYRSLIGSLGVVGQMYILCILKMSV